MLGAMYVVNRLAVVMRWKTPMLDWVNELPNDDGRFAPFTEEDIDDEATSFLIPDFEHIEDAEEYLDELKPMLFETELGSWSDDRKRWPAFRNKKMFDEWFEIRMATMTLDLVEEPLEREDA